MNKKYEKLFDEFIDQITDCIGRHDCAHVAEIIDGYVRDPTGTLGCEKYCRDTFERGGHVKLGGMKNGVLGGNFNLAEPKQMIIELESDEGVEEEGDGARGSSQDATNDESASTLVGGDRSELSESDDEYIEDNSEGAFISDPVSSDHLDENDEEFDRGVPYNCENGGRASQQVHQGCVVIPLLETRIVQQIPEPDSTCKFSGNDILEVIRQLKMVECGLCAKKIGVQLRKNFSKSLACHIWTHVSETFHVNRFLCSLCSKHFLYPYNHNSIHHRELYFSERGVAMRKYVVDHCDKYAAYFSQIASECFGSYVATPGGGGNTGNFSTLPHFQVQSEKFGRVASAAMKKVSHARNADSRLIGYFAGTESNISKRNKLAKPAASREPIETAKVSTLKRRKAKKRRRQKLNHFWPPKKREKFCKKKQLNSRHCSKNGGFAASRSNLSSENLHEQDNHTLDNCTLEEDLCKFNDLGVESSWNFVQNIPSTSAQSSTSAKFGQRLSPAHNYADHPKIICAKKTYSHSTNREPGSFSFQIDEASSIGAQKYNLEESCEEDADSSDVDCDGQKGKLLVSKSSSSPTSGSLFGRSVVESESRVLPDVDLRTQGACKLCKWRLSNIALTYKASKQKKIVIDHVWSHIRREFNISRYRCGICDQLYSDRFHHIYDKRCGAKLENMEDQYQQYKEIFDDMFVKCYVQDEFLFVS